MANIKIVKETYTARMDPQLLRAIAMQAAKDGRTKSQVIEDAVRKALKG